MYFTDIITMISLKHTHKTSKQTKTNSFVFNKKIDSKLKLKSSLPSFLNFDTNHMKFRLAKMHGDLTKILKM